MNYKLILTDKYLERGVDRIFDLQKVDGSDWLPNEDLVKMVSSIKPSDYESFFNSVINGDDFIFMEYSQIILSNEQLIENNINEENVLFLLFEDFYELPKYFFIKLVVQLLDNLIENHRVISGKYGVDLLEVDFLKTTRDTLIFNRPVI